MKASSTLRAMAFFHNLAHISGKANRIFIKILLSQMYFWTRKDPFNFGNHPYGPDLSWQRSPLFKQSRLFTVFAVTDNVCLLWLCI